MTSIQMLLSGRASSSWVRTDVGAPVLFSTSSRSPLSLGAYSYVGVEGASYSSIYRVGGVFPPSTLTELITPTNITPGSPVYGALRGGQATVYGSDAYLVGEKYDATASTSAVQIQSDGTATSIGNGDTLNDLGLSTANTALQVGVGPGGIIRTRTSGTWASVSSPTSNDLNAVLFLDKSKSGDSWVAVGASGTALYGSASAGSWLSISSGTPYNLNDVAGIYSGDLVDYALAVGNSGVVRYTSSGSSWSSSVVTPFTSENLQGVCAAPSGSSYAWFVVGDNGAAFYSLATDPFVFYPLYTPTTDNFTCVSSGYAGAYRVLIIGSQEGNILTRIL